MVDSNEEATVPMDSYWLSLTYHMERFTIVVLPMSQITL